MSIDGLTSEADADEASLEAAQSDQQDHEEEREVDGQQETVDEDDEAESEENAEHVSFISHAYSLHQILFTFLELFPSLKIASLLTHSLLGCRMARMAAKKMQVRMSPLRPVSLKQKQVR